MREKVGICQIITFIFAYNLMEVVEAFGGMACFGWTGREVGEF